MKRLLALLLLASLGAAAPMPKVDVATGDWSRLPALQSRGYDHLHSNVMRRLWEIAHSRKCAIPGYSIGNLDFRMSFAAQFNSDGSLARVIVPKLDCPEAEGILAGAVVEMIRGGDYRPTGQSEQGWYQGGLTFGFQSSQG
jgi:hypothetical protein